MLVINLIRLLRVVEVIIRFIIIECNYLFVMMMMMIIIMILVMMMIKIMIKMMLMIVMMMTMIMITIDVSKHNFKQISLTTFILTFQKLILE